MNAFLKLTKLIKRRCWYSKLDGAQDEDLHARQATVKSSLLFLELLVHGLMSSEEDNAKNLAPNQEEIDSLPEL